MASSRRLYSLVASLPLIAVAAWARLRGVDGVIVDGVALPLDTDAHYHLRRAVLTLRDFPHVPITDPLLCWPEGCAATWPPGYDHLLAVFPWALGLGRDLAASARVMVFVPVLIGVALVLVTRSVARRIAGEAPYAEAAGWAAGLLVALLPQSVAITEVGRTDHHGAEALIAALCLRWAIAWEPADAPRAALRWELAGALLLFAGVHVYCGSVLFAATALGLVTLARVVRREPSPSLLGSGALAALGGAGLLLLIDFGWMAAHRPWFHPLQLSLLQPSLLALAGVAALGFGVASRRERAQRTKALAVAAGGLAALGAAVLVAVPEARTALTSGLVGWLAHRDPWMDGIAEVRPVFDRLPTRLDDWRRVRAIGASVAMLFPLTLALSVAGERPVSRNRIFFAGYALVLVGATLLQTRFGRPLVSALAVGAALAVAAVASRFAGEGRSLSERWLSPLVLAAALLWVGVDGQLRGALRPAPEPVLSPIHEVGLFFRQRPVSAVRGRRLGVFASWDRSLDILDVSGRPVVLTGFGPYVTPALFQAAERSWRGDADALATFMARSDAGNLVIGYRQYQKMSHARGGPFLREESGTATPNMDFLREQPASVLALGGGGAPEASVAHAGHFLPVFASSAPVPGLSPLTPSLWVHELVEGARVTGNAPDGAIVRCTVDLFVRGVRRPWVGWTVARGGRFEVVLPVPTGLHLPTIRTGERYLLRVGEREAGSFALPLDAVQRGSVVDVGGLQLQAVARPGATLLARWRSPRGR